MEISLMRSRITIQKSVITMDSVGNHLAAWTDYYSCYAYANIAQTESGGKEYEAAGQTVASDAFVFTVRYCGQLAVLDTTGYRIVFNGHIYNIVKIKASETTKASMYVSALESRLNSCCGDIPPSGIVMP